MLADHIRHLPVKWNSDVFVGLFMVGRMAFPLFAWELSECFHFTKHPTKHLLNIGLQTLHLRMAQHCKNAQRVAEFLHDCPKVAWVHYCGLKDDQYYELGQKYLPNGSCGVIAFGLKGDRETAIKWMDSLQMINIVTHVADARTCVLHPASHTHRQLSDEQLREAGVAPDLIRLSVGIEDVEDILDDIKQALDKI